MSWPWLLVTCAGCALLKLAGTAVPEALLERAVLRRAAALLPIAMLAALSAVQTVSTGRELVVDARLAGVAAGIVALLLRAPFLVVVVAAAASTASARLLL